jgi:hypothetical protein
MVEYQVTVQPMSPGHDGRETHPHLQRDSGSLRQDGHRTDVRHDLEYPIKGRTHRRIRTHEMSIDVAKRSAGVRLVSVGERPRT